MSGRRKGMVLSCILLSLLVCVVISGCTGTGGAGSGPAQDDSIGDAGLDGITAMNGKEKKTAEELLQEVKEYPAPDERFCGKWKGHPEKGSGDYRLTLETPDAAGAYPVSASFNWISTDSGNGLFVDILDISAEAVISDGVMMVTGTYDGGGWSAEGEKTIRAVLGQYNGGLRLVVLDCDAFRVKPGDCFDFERDEE